MQLFYIYPTHTHTHTVAYIKLGNIIPDTAVFHQNKTLGGEKKSSQCMILNT
jgi:hypothetical protein